MAVIGILARIESSRYESLFDQLHEREGTTPFPIEGETSRLGILIESSSSTEAYRILDTLQKKEEIHCLWPVYEHLEEEFISIDASPEFKNLSNDQKPIPFKEMQT